MTGLYHGNSVRSAFTEWRAVSVVIHRACKCQSADNQAVWEVPICSFCTGLLLSSCGQLSLSRLAESWRSCLERGAALWCTTTVQYLLRGVAGWLTWGNQWPYISVKRNLTLPPREWGWVGSSSSDGRLSGQARRGQWGKAFIQHQEGSRPTMLMEKKPDSEGAENEISVGQEQEWLEMTLFIDPSTISM